MDQDKTYILLAKFIAGEATSEELEQLEWAFLANPELRRLAEQLPGWRQSPPKGVSTEEEQQLLQRGLQQFARMKEKTGSPATPSMKSLPATRPIGEGQATSDTPVIYANPTPPARVRRLATRWIAAASVAILLVTGAILYFHPSRPIEASRLAPAVIAAVRGTRRFMKLPDGSQLWLNAGSKVIFNDGYAAGERELTLEGEAFFDIKHDPLHPFIIHTGRLEVKVLGTTLNVKAYPDDSAVETTLINGKVEIGIAGDSQTSIILHPNEKVIIPTGVAAAFPAKRSDSIAEQPAANTPVSFTRGPVVPDRTDGTITETSWVENKLVFRQQTLSGLAAQLERWYNVKIIFANDRYLRDTISGTFPDVPITDVMHALQITAGFHYSVARDTVRIW
jgi:transmembrane sensor